ncbi:MAG: M15 family metallopeptidase [Bacteroidales bacterium]
MIRFLIYMVVLSGFWLMSSCRQDTIPDQQKQKTKKTKQAMEKESREKQAAETEQEPVLHSKITQELAEMKLQNVKHHISGLIVELKYSTDDNFLGFDVYGELTEAYLQPECIEKLKKAYELLQEKLPGHTFIIYDAARPLSVQQVMWDSIDVPGHQKFWYVAPPGKGSIHNYGMAVDLTIADEQGAALDMGTSYDHFGKLSFPRYTQKFLEKGKLTQEQAGNRELLTGIMHAAGFTVGRTEWWHFNATSLEDAKNRFEIIK